MKSFKYTLILMVLATFGVTGISDGARGDSKTTDTSSPVAEMAAPFSDLSSQCKKKTSTLFAYVQEERTKLIAVLHQFTDEEINSMFEERDGLIIQALIHIPWAVTNRLLITGPVNQCVVDLRKLEKDLSNSKISKKIIREDFELWSGCIKDMEAALPSPVYGPITSCYQGKLP